MNSPLIPSGFEVPPQRSFIADGNFVDEFYELCEAAARYVNYSNRLNFDDRKQEAVLAILSRLDVVRKATDPRKMAWTIATNHLRDLFRSEKRRKEKLFTEVGTDGDDPKAQEMLDQHQFDEYCQNYPTSHRLWTNEGLSQLERALPDAFAQLSAVRGAPMDLSVLLGARSGICGYGRDCGTLTIREICRIFGLRPKEARYWIGRAMTILRDALAGEVAKIVEGNRHA